MNLLFGMTRHLGRIGGEYLGIGLVLILVVAVFTGTADGFWSVATFQSVAFQLPELGLLTLAMLIPILSGGLNLAITYTANLAGLVCAWTLQAFGGPDAGVWAFAAGILAALSVGGMVGLLMGVIIAYVRAHPILVSLSMMIFLRGVGEFLTRGGDVSGFPEFVSLVGHGSILGLPIPLIVFLALAAIWHVLLSRSKLGFSTYMVGSNERASLFSGIDTKRALTLIYGLSGVMSAIAGIIMLTRFNSVRVGHGEAFILITVLACFLGGVDPFGGFGRVVSVVIALVILQIISSGLNLLGVNQHLTTALWGSFLILVMVGRWAWFRFR